MAAVFLTRAKVKAVLGIPTGVTQHDDLIDAYLVPAESAVLDYIGQAALTLTSYDETHDIGKGQGWIAVDAVPIVSVAALTDDGSLVAAADYYREDKTGYIRLESAGYFTEGRQKVQVTYTAGYSPVPDRFIMAAALQAASWFNAGIHAGMQSEGTSGYRYTRNGRVIDPTVASMLNGDRRVMPRRRWNPED